MLTERRITQTQYMNTTVTYSFLYLKEPIVDCMFDDDLLFVARFRCSFKLRRNEPTQQAQAEPSYPTRTFSCVVRKSVEI